MGLFFFPLVIQKYYMRMATLVSVFSQRWSEHVGGEKNKLFLSGKVTHIIIELF